MAAPMNKTSGGLTARIQRRREWWKSRQDADADGCAEHNEEEEEEEMEADDTGQLQQQPEHAKGKVKKDAKIASTVAIATRAAPARPTAKRQAMGQDGCGDCIVPAKKALKHTDMSAVCTAMASENFSDGEEAVVNEKKKKKKKEKNRKDHPDKATVEDELATGDSSEAKTPNSTAAAIANTAMGSKMQQHVGRSSGGKVYVVFVGNLPFDVTKEQLSEHFSLAGNIKAIRIPTAKDTGKPRGFAYIEFGDKRSHRLGLGLHQTELGQRKINVEFTSAGGRCEKRLEHLRQKNKALERFKQLPWS